MDSFTFATFFTTSAEEISSSVPVNAEDGDGSGGSNAYCVVA
jgi:hypothetical protein